MNTGNRILWDRFCNNCNVLDINFVSWIIFGEFIWSMIPFLFFSTKVSPSVSGEQVGQIPELEDISEEETKTARAAKSSLKVAKLKVPQK